MSQLQQIQKNLWKKLKPPPRLTVSEWAERYRFLSAESSAEPGKWYNSRAPHLVAPMDALSPSDPCEEVILCFSSQTGKTEVANNFVGFIVDQDPGPTLVIQPNVKPMAEAWSKDRLATMVRDTPTLKGRVSDPKSRDSGNTMLHKSFSGGHITIGGANSPAGLASRPIRYLICDEIDRYQITKEGDAKKLAKKRTQTFWNRKILLISTPTIEDFGVDAEYKASQQHEWQLRCLNCGEKQFPQLRHFAWDDERKDRAVNIIYLCEHCGHTHTEKDEFKVKATGDYSQTSSDNQKRKGFKINQWASPFANWAETVQEFRDAGKDPAKLQTVVNTAFCETWKDAAQEADANTLKTRRENYGSDAIPGDILILTAAADVQDDRIEYEIVGWGADYETWGVEQAVFYGDPAQDDVWYKLDIKLQESFLVSDGRILRTQAACIDSAGHHTEAVYRFCAGKQRRKIYPIIGREGPRPIWPKRAGKSKKAKAYGVETYAIGIDPAKEAFYSRLRIDDHGPGYIHVPISYDDEWCDQATSERVETKYFRGFQKRIWVKPSGRRNEALDMRVYNHAALLSIRQGREPDWRALRYQAGQQIMQRQEQQDMPISHRSRTRQPRFRFKH